MVGAIWFVQIVHYPLFAQVGSDSFSEYEKEHIRRTGWILAPVMIAELISALYLWTNAPSMETSASMLLLGVIWAITFFVSVPAHRELSSRFSQEAHQKLVRTNWIRCIAWTTKALITLSLPL